MILRVMIFPERPECLLLVTPEDSDDAIALPTLTPPFDKKTVADAFAAAHVPVRVEEAPAGRWSQAMLQARRSQRSEAGQQNRQREATTAAIMRASPVLEVRTHADALAKKIEVDESIRVLKAKIATAKSEAYTRGVYMPARDFRSLEERLERLKQDSQALQTRLAELKREEKRTNARLDGHAFRQACMDILPPSLLREVRARADELHEAFELGDGPVIAQDDEGSLA